MNKVILSLALKIFCMYSLINAQTPSTQKWVFETGDGMWSSPAIGADGTIYVGSYDDNLYAINPDGTQKWAFETGHNVKSSPAIGADGTIYIGSGDNNLYAINPDGTQKWAFKTGNLVYSSPAIGADSTIYVGSWDEKLYAIKPDGTQKWAFKTGDDIWSSPAIGTDGTIYVGSIDDNLYAINPDGTQKWAFETGHNVKSSPAIGADGTIYIGSWDNNLYAIKPDGTQKWAFETGSTVYSSPSIGADGTIYVGSYDDNLYAINPDGTQKWAFETGSTVYSSPAIGADSTIYVGSIDDNLYAINPDGTRKWAFKTGDNVGSSPAIGADGTIYVGSSDNNLYAIHSSSMGLAGSSWPKFHQNSQNTGFLRTLYIVDNTFNITFSEMEDPGIYIIKAYHFFLEDIIITDCTFDNPLFSINTPLPLTIKRGAQLVLTVQLQADSTGLYTSSLQAAYEIGGANKTKTVQTAAGIFLEDGSERTHVAHRVKKAYDECMADDPETAATQNNKGLLYRLLKRPDLAEPDLMDAVSTSLNDKFGYTGIMMNLGVVKSDQSLASEADEFYNVALADLSSNKDESTLAPQVYYNQAWEAYMNDDFTGADTSIAKTLSHVMTNDFLKAKAYVLRGAIYYQNGNTDAAIDDFNQAVLLDPDGPIGRLAQENLDALNTGVGDITAGLPQEFTLMPNYPNPFNPETMVSFGLPRDCEIKLIVYNVLGRVVRTLRKGMYKAGWHTLRWDGLDDSGRQVGTGIYLLMMNAGEFKSVQKMMLLR